MQRSQSEGTDSASLILKAGDTVDDTMTAFNAVNLTGGSRKALTSLCVGMLLSLFVHYFSTLMQRYHKEKLRKFSYN